VSQNPIWQPYWKHPKFQTMEEKQKEVVKIKVANGSFHGSLLARPMPLYPMHYFFLIFFFAGFVQLEEEYRQHNTALQLQNQ
jgi:hypothetical protein